MAEVKNPSEVRKEQKLALQTESENAFEKIAREWHQLKSAKWSAGYASDIMEAFKNDIFPYVGTRPVGEIKPLELLNVLCKIEKGGALEKMRKCDSVAPKCFATQLQLAGRSIILRRIFPALSKYINPIISRS